MSMDAEGERELITQAALDYFEGWYDADPVRMDRALHADLVKRSFDADGRRSLGPRRDKAQMIEMTEGGGGSERGPASEQSIEVEVLDVHRGSASVVVRSAEYHEHLHLVRTADGWRIVSALWENTE
jgi:hypothetical protein